MAFETKEELLEKYLKMDKPHCPHCDQPMTLWEIPPINFSDGLGWQTPYLFVCFNDDCPSYKKGWEHMEESMKRSPPTDVFANQALIILNTCLYSVPWAAPALLWMMRRLLRNTKKKS